MMLPLLLNHLLWFLLLKVSLQLLLFLLQVRLLRLCQLQVLLHFTQQNQQQQQQELHLNKMSVKATLKSVSVNR